MTENRYNSLTERIILKNICPEVEREGEYLAVKIDLLLGHDATIALLIDDFRKIGGKIWDRRKVIFTADHFAPPASIGRADILKKSIEFFRGEGVSDYHLFKGICHQILVEDSRTLPYKIIIGADSHTVTAGALGAFASGFGSTDILYALLTGKIWLRIPRAVKITLKGRIPDYILGKDIILNLIGELGEGGANYRALEFFDDTENKVSMDGRLSICNMVVECGAKNGLFVPDSITSKYLKFRDGGSVKVEEVLPPAPISYEKEININVTELEPKVALPHSPSNVVSVSEIAGEKIDQVFIGSCAGGRLEDLQVASRILKDKKIPSHLKLIVIPASTGVLKSAIEKYYIQTLIDAGAVICNPSCGPCGGIDKGLLGEDEVCISTSNRNFKGRMGHSESSVFLASTLTAAASAVEGRIADPRDFIM